MSLVKKTIIRIKNVSKTYRSPGGDGIGHVEALKKINLEILPGEFVAITGSSGSGKSTLMQIMGLLDHSTEGTYELDGVNVKGLGQDQLARLRSKKVGFIFQFFNLLARTTAIENVNLPLLYSDEYVEQDRGLRQLQRLGLEHRIHHLPSELSGGQQQRVAIARALVNNPKIVLADEPTGNLGSKQSHEIMDILSELNSNGVTIVLVTHETEIANRTQRIITLKDGEIVGDVTSSLSMNRGYKPGLVLGKPKKSNLICQAVENVKVAKTALSLNKLRSGLATLGIVIGIASVVTMVAIGEGAKKAINNQFSSLGTNILTIKAKTSLGRGQPKKKKFNLSDFWAIKKLKAEGLIYRADARVFGAAIVSHKGLSRRTGVIGAYPEIEKMQNYEPKVGRFFTHSEVNSKSKVALLGATVAKFLFPSGENPVGQSVNINRAKFKVIGVLPSKGATAFEDSDDQILIPFKTAMKRVFGKNLFNVMAVEVAGDGKSKNALKRIEMVLRQRRGLQVREPNNFEIRSMDEVVKIYNRITGIISTMLANIAVISLLVGGIGIMNVMLVAVKERTREIGLRKALGAKGQDILSQFLVESVVIGLLGGLLGTVVGVGAALGISAFFEWPVIIPLRSIVLSFVFSLGVGMVFGIWPAKEAANLSPIEALRYE